DSVGNTVPAAAVNWRSTDEGVVTVDANGLATARRVGTAVITATAVCCGGPSDGAMVTVDDPPPPVEGFPNLPASWTVVNDNPWDAIPNWNSSCAATGGVNGLANGWGKVISSGPGGCPEGEGAVVQLADAPDGDPDVFRMTWNPGHPGGQDGYGVFYSPGEQGHASRDIHFTTWFRFGDAGDPSSFKRHGNGLKMISFDGVQFGQRTNMVWSDLNFGGGPCPDAFAMSAPDGPFGDAIHWTSQISGYESVKFRASCMSGQEHHQQGFFAHPDQGYDPSVRMPIGEWVLLEIRWEANPARIRWWWNGQLVADFTGGTIPYEIHDILMDGTWGGGPSNVPSPQHWYIARTVVAVP
ncbi:MAG: Ig-like domain-containing protein, partial [Longimicrobiales bacterium]